MSFFCQLLFQASFLWVVLSQARKPCRLQSHLMYSEGGDKIVHCHLELDCPSHLILEPHQIIRYISQENRPLWLFEQPLIPARAKGVGNLLHPAQPRQTLECGNTSHNFGIIDIFSEKEFPVYSLSGNGKTRDKSNYFLHTQKFWLGKLMCSLFFMSEKLCKSTFLLNLPWIFLLCV